MAILRNLQVKVLLAALIPGLAVMLAVALITIFVYNDAVAELVERRDEEIARVSAARLGDTLDRQTATLEALAADSELWALYEGSPPSALAAAALGSFDGGVALYGADGALAWTSGSHRLEGAAEAFEKVRGSLAPARSVAAEAEASEPRGAIRIAVPVEGRDGEFAGALMGVATLEKTALGEILAEPRGEEPFDGGIAYSLVDSLGRSIYQSAGNPLVYFQPETLSSGGSTRSRAPSGEWVALGVALVPGTGWRVVVQQSLSALEQPIRSFGISLYGLLLLGGALAAGGVWYFIGRALKPIRDLNAGAQRIAGGDFDYPISISASAGDEVRDLAEQFGIMAQSLKRSYADLEERVELRTRELAEAEERVRAVAEENAVMAEIGLVVGSSLDLSLVYERFAEQTKRLIACDATAVISVYPALDEFKMEYISGLDIHERQEGESYPLAGTPTFTAYSTGEPVLSMPRSEDEVAEQFPGLLAAWRQGIKSFLALPLKSQGEVIGVMWVGSREEQAYSSRDAAIAERVASQIVGAIANARLYEEVQRVYAHEQRRAEQFRAIGEMGREITAILDTEELLRKIGEIGRSALDYEASALGIVEDGYLVFSTAANPLLSEPVRISLARGDDARSVPALVAATGSPMIVPDAQAEPRAVSLDGRLDARSAVAVPVFASGRTLGVLHCQSARLNAFDEADRVALQAMAQEIGIAIQNARIFEEERRRNEHMAVINSVALDVSAVLTLSELLPHVVQTVRETFGYYAAAVFLTDDEAEGAVALQAASGADDAPFPQRGSRLKGGIVGHVAASGQPWASGDVSSDPFYTDWDIEGTRTKSELAAPIKQGDVVVGVLDIHSESLNGFDDIDMLVAQMLANQLAVAIENARIFSETRDLAVLEERNRMAREIHDTLAQGFTGIVIQLEAGEEAIGDDDPNDARERIRVAKTLARECLSEARRSVWDLLPEALEQDPLEVIIANDVERFHATQEARARFTLLGARRELPAASRAALMRICQEALTNIRKYARASEVSVTLDYALDSVTLTVRDNGVGFDPESVRLLEGRGGFGITGMRQRARLLNGDVDIASAPGEGAIVRARLPVG